MSAEQLEVLEQLARRAVACKRWRWMPGMLTTYGTRVYSITRAGLPKASRGGLIEADPLPALDDPATLGCLLALVREAYGDTQLHLALDWTLHGDWYVCFSSTFESIQGRTETETLVAALEAAPVVK